MNRQNDPPLPKLRAVANPASCRTQKTTSRALNPRFDQGSELKVIVAYDGFNGGHRARYFLEGLAERFSRIFAFIPHFMKIEDFGKPRSGEPQQPGEVAAVDIIVIIADEHADLRDLSKEWMRRWKMEGKTEGRRLLALFSASREENDRWNQTQSRLHQMARRNGMRFDPQTPPMPGMACRAAKATPRALQRSDECGAKLRCLRNAGQSFNNSPRRADAGETPVDPPMTAVSSAIVEVLRSRQRKAASSTMPLTNGRSKRSPETN